MALNMNVHILIHFIFLQRFKYKIKRLNLKLNYLLALQIVYTFIIRVCMNNNILLSVANVYEVLLIRFFIMIFKLTVMIFA